MHILGTLALKITQLKRISIKNNVAGKDSLPEVLAGYVIFNQHLKTSKTPEWRRATFRLSKWSKHGQNGRKTVKMTKISKMAKLGHKNVTHQTFFTKSPQKYFEWRAKTVKNEFPTHESTYPYVFRFFLEIFWPNKKKLSVTKV